MLFLVWVFGFGRDGGIDIFVKYFGLFWRRKFIGYILRNSF